MADKNTAGKWIPVPNPYGNLHNKWACPYCGKMIQIADYRAESPYMFCPHCGKQLRETDAENSAE